MEELTIDLEDKVARYYDPNGISEEKQSFASKYVVSVIEERVGYPVTVITEFNEGNGYLQVYFEAT